MYTTLLALHSLFRWLVLLSLAVSIFKAYRGWFGGKAFSKTDNALRHNTATILHIQFLLGVTLYIISPLVNYFWQNPSEAIHEHEIRFFGMEHITIMLIAIVVVTIGSAKAKRKVEDLEKFKTMTIWFSVGLFLILTSIPWEFSPFTSRPYFRGF